MMELILIAVGIILGLGGGVVLLRFLLRLPAIRVFFADLFNWTDAELPSGSIQVLRHGRWIASKHEDVT